MEEEHRWSRAQLRTKSISIHEYTRNKMQTKSNSRTHWKQKTFKNHSKSIWLRKSNVLLFWTFQYVEKSIGFISLPRISNSGNVVENYFSFFEVKAKNWNTFKTSLGGEIKFKSNNRKQFPERWVPGILPTQDFQLYFLYNIYENCCN